MTDSADGPGVELIPQPHGGALQRGNPRGKTGRLPSILRRSAREVAGEGLPIVRAIMLGEHPEARPADQVAAFNALARVGLGEAANLEDVRERLRAQIALIKRQKLWSTPDLLDQLEKIWR